jgi:hypothetical protein
VIRFSAALVVVAIGVLVAGVALSSLPFVYVAIGVSAVALLVLAAGVVLKRDELFDEEAQATAGTPVAGAQPAVGVQPAAEGAPAAAAYVGGAGQPRVAAGVGGSVSGSTMSGDTALSGGTALSSGTAFSGDTASSGDAPFGDWASTRYAQPAPVQQAHDGTPGRAGAVSPGTWPPSVPGVPAAGDALSGTPEPIPPASFRRPPAPPTRADPVLPWADSLPTRVDISGTPRTPGADTGSSPSGSSSSSGPSAGLPANGLLPGGKFAWRDITWDDSAGDKPRAGERDSGERDGGEEETDPTAATVRIAPLASTPPPASAVASAGTPSWFDDVDDASDATLSLGQPGRDDHLSFPVGEAPAHAVAHDIEVPADTGDDVDLDATAAMPIQPGPDPGTHEDLNATVAMGVLPGPDADTDVDAEADPGPEVDADANHAWADLDADPDPDADVDLHADPAQDEELPGAPDEDDLAPTAANETIAPEITAAEPASGTGQVTVVPGVPRYHNGDCILIRFMADEDVQRMTVSEAKKAGCTPCRACQPED